MEETISGANLLAICLSITGAVRQRLLERRRSFTGLLADVETLELRCDALPGTQHRLRLSVCIHNMQTRQAGSAWQCIAAVGPARSLFKRGLRSFGRFLLRQAAYYLTHTAAFFFALARPVRPVRLLRPRAEPNLTHSTHAQHFDERADEPHRAAQQSEGHASDSDRLEALSRA